MTSEELLRLADNIERTAAYTARRLGVDTFKTPDGGRSPAQTRVILINAERRDDIVRALRLYAGVTSVPPYTKHDFQAGEQ